MNKPPLKTPGQDLDLTQRVVFQNNHLIVIDKPSGWLSVPSRLGPADLRPCLGVTLQNQMEERLWPVHRLDLEVSGLLVFARNAKAHKVLNSMFEERQVEKTYHGVTAAPEDFIPPDTKLSPLPFVSAEWRANALEWRSKLVRGKKRSFEADHGHPSVTFAHCSGAFQGSSSPASPHALNWELQPHTGRPHQLRYELSKRGFPIWGDKLYGGPNVFKSPGFIALRCMNLRFLLKHTHLGNDLPESFTTTISLASLISEEHP